MADKNTYYITLQPKVDKNTIKEMENKFNTASKNIGKNLSNSLKSAIKGSALAMVGAFGVGSMVSNVLGDIVNLPNKTKNIAIELKTLAIQTKNLSEISDLSTGQFASLYQGLQSAGFTGDINDLREVLAETAKSKATGGIYEGSKVATGEILAQALQQWQDAGRKYGTDSKEFQDAKKNFETLSGGVDTARKFEALVKGDKNIKNIIIQGQKELEIKKGSSDIYNRNVEKLKGLTAQSQEAKMQKFLFSKNIDEKAIAELNKILDSDLSMALSGLTDSQKLSSQIQISNTIKETQLKMVDLVMDVVKILKNIDEKFDKWFGSKQLTKKEEIQAVKQIKLNQTGQLMVDDLKRQGGTAEQVKQLISILSKGGALDG